MLFTFSINASKNELGIASTIHNNASMSEKKNTTIGVRVDDDLLNVIKGLATKEDRPIAAMTRVLVKEALLKRKLLK